MEPGSSMDQFELKERIRQATDIVDLVSRYGEMRRQGRLWVTRCPWHDDRRPSMQVNAERQSWKCWVCDIGGDVFSFLMRRENLNFPEALRMLGERAGIEVPTFSPQEKGSQIKRGGMLETMKWACDQMHSYLLNSPDATTARNYLTDRGISQAAIEAFGIGFAPNQWDWLTGLAKHHNIPLDILDDIGVCRKKSTGQGAFDFFRGRVMFPICDAQSRPISMGGRVLPEIADLEESQGRTAAKYINGPETKIYSKSNNLYGLNLVKDAVQKSRHLVIVEGYTDVVMAWQAGLDNVVAVQGTALNDRHINLIRRYADLVTLVLDGDEAGIRRTNEILNLFVAADFDMRIAILPDQMDPFDFLANHSASEFRDHIENAVDALEYKFRLETEGFDPVSETQKAQRALTNILTTLAGAPTGKKQATAERNLREQQIVARLARYFQVNRQSILDRLGEIRHNKRRSTFRAPKPERATPKVQRDFTSPLKWDSKRLEVLELLVLQPGFLELVVERIPADWFCDHSTRTIFNLFCKCYEEGFSTDFPSLLGRAETPELQNILVSLDEIAKEKSDATELTMEDRLATVLDWFYNQEVQESQRKKVADLETQQLDEDEELAELQALLHQQRQRQGIDSPTEG